jgi:sporulation protein YlmC with PRC-barrel domain
MLRNIRELEKLQIGATDGAIGELKDCYFDDESWVVRYLVVDAGSWLSSKKVLLSPYSIGAVDWEGKSIAASVTKDQIKNSPSIDIHRPVSRQFEREYLGYYNYPYYWGGSYLWGMGEYPEIVKDSDYAAARRDAQDRNAGDPHLRSCNAVHGYHVHATDGEIGHVQGYLVDPRSWAIRYVIVNTSNWWMGHSVLISPEWIDRVSWEEKTVNIDWTRQAVKEAPIYDPALPLDRMAESKLYGHYGYTSYYWDDADRRRVA